MIPEVNAFSFLILSQAQLTRLFCVSYTKSIRAAGHNGGEKRLNFHGEMLGYRKPR